MILLLLILILFGAAIFKTSWFLVKLVVGILSTILLIIMTMTVAVAFSPLILLVIGYIIYVIYQHSQA
ncbi:hypothetical protein YK48G_20010 [Lentilactobacillus fungorum]|uniref:Uncharacterized protein n=1 Tax=Lentilactobacillus fungorum TaxID=2201250 RepID=A0ABQ3W2U6_9LACO|nr:hypothetical protein [Lentilactobacillus fungorum]GHP14576.1 hypothetical protein YK48G_20010 [Lentilactobacillus fungorum]